jgi:peptidyl-prolyl cis-trans isomerase A (cyclophilin A)
VQTSAGEMVFEVLPVNAPITSANFLQYVTEGFYSGTLIHRVERDFVIQGGGYTTGLAPKAPTHAAITLESQNGLSNQQYTLAMARGTDPNSATSQFFVNVFDNSATLDYKAGAGGRDGYAVFGQVIAGTAVVDALNNVATTTSGGLQNVPVNEVVIRGMIRLP